MNNYYLILQINENRLIKDTIILNHKDDIGYSGYSSLKSAMFPFCNIETFKKKQYIIIPISQERFNDFLLSKKVYFIKNNYLDFLKKEGLEEYAI